MSTAARKPLRVGVASAATVVIASAVVGCTGDNALPASPGLSSNSSSPSEAVPSRSGPAVGSLPASLTGQKLGWKKCARPTPAQGGGKAPGRQWECATLRAPLDYARPDGETTGIALIRAKAKDPGRRLGSLVFNFGGPGGSGITTLPGFAKDYKKLRSRYDLVSFDPRGVGASAGVTCLSDQETDTFHAGDRSPDNASEASAVIAANKKYAEACQRNSGRILPHVDTVSAARDLDLMRRVLGDKKLNYFGISYGTKLGGVYAHLFPKNVGRAVLDAVVDPTETTLSAALGQAKGFQLALNHFMDACAAQFRSDCPTGQSAADGNKKLAALLKRLDQHPLPTHSGRKLTQDQAVTGIAAALYSEEGWPALAQALHEALASGQGDTLLALANSYNGRDEHGRYNNMSAANLAVTCADSKRRYTTDGVKTNMPRFRKASPVFGESTAWSLLGCTNWPVTGTTDKTHVSAPGAAPILVIGNTGDPATPVAGARKMADQLGKNAGVLLTVRGEGHGTYGTNPCATETVNSYLLSGDIPALGSTCP